MMDEEPMEDGAERDLGDSRKMRPPNKKKFEEEIETIQNQIKEIEKELRSLQQRKDEMTPGDAKAMRAEREATTDRRRKLEADLSAINKEISEKMGQLTRVQSNLHYKNEEKINEAIRKLEHTLKVQNFKLREEKKIVAEIDSLKRSKKVLSQYNAMKKEIDEKRARQRRMREERDHYYKVVNGLKAKEDVGKKAAIESKKRMVELKTELDALYEEKRRLSSEFKRQREDFSEAKQKQRQESQKKREEERRQMQEAQRKERLELAVLKEPYEEEILLCNTLLTYLQRFNSAQPDPNDPAPLHRSLDETALSAMQQAASAPAPELDDGNLVLLRKSEDSEYFGLGRRQSKSRRKSRKQSMTKLITHTPQVIGQFASINLRAPSSMSEVGVSMEQLLARKEYYQQEAKKVCVLRQVERMGGLGLVNPLSLSPSPSLGGCSGLSDHSDLPEELSQSDPCISATESVAAEMSRQPSKTESCESSADTRPEEQVMEELIRLSQEACAEEGDVSFSLEDRLEDIKISDNHSDSSETLRSESTTEGNGDSQCTSLSASGRLADFEGCVGVDNEGTVAEATPANDSDVKSAPENDYEEDMHNGGDHAECDAAFEDGMPEDSQSGSDNRHQTAQSDSCKSGCGGEVEGEVDYNSNHEIDTTDIHMTGGDSTPLQGSQKQSQKPSQGTETTDSVKSPSCICKPQVVSDVSVMQTSVSSCDSESTSFCCQTQLVDGSSDPAIDITSL